MIAFRGGSENKALSRISEALGPGVTGYHCTWGFYRTANTRVQETRDFERGSEGQFLRAILEVRWPTWGFLAPIPS